MRAVTIKEAKARLNELVEAAARGEDVVLMKGARHVAAIVPISAEDLEIASRVTDDQAARLWSQIAEERRGGKLAVFESSEEAAAYLRGPSRRRVKGSRGRR
jgi:prevent-host-death family protein